jgi:hypothetical protein
MNYRRWPPQTSCNKVFVNPISGCVRTACSQLLRQAGTSCYHFVTRLMAQGFFQGFFRAVKRPQKLNLELSFETQSSHQKILCSKMKLFELNSWRVQISFQLKTWKLSKKWLEFISQHKKNNAFPIFNQFIVSLSAPALTHCISTSQLH